MAEIINFRKARKQRARADAEKTASDNRVKFGRTKQQRQTDDHNEKMRVSRLDAHRREPAADDE